MGRSLLIARALEARTSVRIHFACLSGGGGRFQFQRQLLEPDYPVTALPVYNPADHGIAVADRLEQLMAELQPAFIFCDLNPMPALLLVRFPEVPRVYLVNAYETRLGSDETVLDIAWTREGNVWNSLREARGLQAIENPRSFYEPDRVLLPDPPAIIGKPAEALPPGYIPIGPCLWEPPTDLPAELEDTRDLLLVSMGSTGVKHLPLEVVEHIAQSVGASRTIRIGTFDPGYSAHITNYQWLPGSRLMPHCKFVLTQGGAGSTYQALCAGVPVVCIPSHQNHIALAQLLQQLEAGIMLRTDSWQSQLRGLSRDIRKLQTGAGILASQMKHLDGPGNAARAMLDLVG